MEKSLATRLSRIPDSLLPLNLNINTSSHLSPSIFFRYLFAHLLSVAALVGDRVPLLFKRYFMIMIAVPILTPSWTI